MGKDGIRFRGLAYLAPQLQGRRGQRVRIRYAPHDDRSLEVYADGEHLCTAHPQAHLTPEQVQAFRTAQQEEARRLAAERRRTTRRSRTELAPMTGAAPAAGSRLLSADAADELATRRSRRTLAAKSSKRLAQVRLEQGPLSVDQARVLFFSLVGEPVAEDGPGLTALRDDGLLTTADRDGVCADLALAPDPENPEEDGELLTSSWPEVLTDSWPIH